MAATILLDIHSTKLLYATLLKALTLWAQIRHRREMLADMLPDIATQWEIFKKVAAACISRKVAVTASLSKDEKVPDETRVPGAVEITTGTARLMYRLATALGLTLNTDDYQWNDADSGFREAIANFAAVAGILIEIEQLATDLTMHRAYAADLYTDQAEQRTPGQVEIYSECDAPLCDSIFVDQFSRTGMMAGFGSLYLGWLMLSTEDLVTGTPPCVETGYAEVTATPEDDPDDPGANTRYNFAAPSGWSLAGVVVAAFPSLAAPETFYSSVAYASATAGYLSLAGNYTDPTQPGTIAFKLLLIRTT